MAEPTKEPKVRVICKHCGSEQVTRDAWAEWDVSAQDWRLGAVFDYPWCHRCQGDARLEERPVEG